MDNHDSFDRMLSDHMQRTTPKVSDPRYKLDVVKTRIAAERALAPHAIQRSTTSPSGLGGWLRNLFTVQSSRHGLAMGIIAMQFAALAGLALHSNQRGPELSETRTTATGMIAPSNIDFIRISFKPTATEREIRNALNSVHGDIVAGPSQIGEYYVLTPQAQILAHVATLKSSSVIEVVDVVKKLP